MNTASPAPQRLGSGQWKGVMMRSDPATIPPGYCAEARNMRFTRGIPETRKGTLKPPWVNRISSGNVVPWGNVYGTGQFRDPESGQLYLLIASSLGVYATLPNNAPFAVPLPGGVTLTGEVTFVHGPDVVVLLRGESATALAMTNLRTGFTAVTKVNTWSITVSPESNAVYLEAHGFVVGDLVTLDGTTLPAAQTIPAGGDPTNLTYTAATVFYVESVLDADHFTLSDNSFLTNRVHFEDPGAGLEITAVDGTQDLPGGLYGFFCANRLFVLNGDVLYASDPLDYTRVSVLDQLRIHQGGGETLEVAGVFGDSTVICLKSRSALKVTGIYGDLSAARQAVVTRRYGCVAPRTAIDVGTDFVWLSGDGVASLSLTEFGEVQASQGALAGKPPMLSDDIAPLIARINWAYAGNACAAIWDNKLFLAVPLDAAEIERDEIVSAGEVYDATGEYTPAINLTAGAEYRVIFGDNEVSNSVYLENDTTTVASTGSRVKYFTGIDAPATFRDDSTGINGQAVTASLQRVLRGVNTAVLVYDFINAAWSGYDTFTGLDVKGLFVYPYQDRDRLFFYTSDGYVFLYEEGFDDQIPEPYVDIGFVSMPTEGDTLKIGDGTTITSYNDNVHNGALGSWATGTVAYATAYFWSESGYGYSPTVTNTWLGTNVVATRIADNTYTYLYRFTATNGLLPAVLVNGSDWPGTAWLYCREVTTQPIQSYFKDRSYALPGHYPQRPEDLLCVVSSWNPTLTFGMIYDGVEESLTLRADATRSRTSYDRPFDAAAWVNTNANDDFHTPYRQDYSVALGPDASATLALGTNGVTLDLFQEFPWKFTSVIPGARCRTAQPVIENTTGRIRIQGDWLDTRGQPQTAGTHV